MPLSPPRCLARSTLLVVKMWGHDNPPLPNLLVLKQKHSRVLKICPPCRRTGEWNNVQKKWPSKSTQHVKFSQEQAMPGSHCLHCTPFSENSFQHNLWDKNMHGSHSLNYKYPPWKFIITRNEIHDVEIIPLHQKLEICEISPPNIKFFMCLMDINIESHNDVVAMA